MAELQVTSAPERFERPIRSAKASCSRLPASPEFELLLRCAQSIPKSERSTWIQDLVSGGIDWETLIEAANRHCLLPLLYWQLNESCDSHLPSYVLDRLREHFIATELRNRMLLAELHRLLDLFNRHGITAVPFKGPLLALTVYGHIAHRQFGDLDILIPKAQLTNARELLIAQGYWQRLPFGAFTTGSTVADDYVPTAYTQAQQRAHTRWYTEPRMISLVQTA